MNSWSLLQTGRVLLLFERRFISSLTGLVRRGWKRGTRVRVNPSHSVPGRKAVGEVSQSIRSTRPAVQRAFSYHTHFTLNIDQKVRGYWAGMSYKKAGIQNLCKDWFYSISPLIQNTGRVQSPSWCNDLIILDLSAWSTSLHTLVEQSPLIIFID